MPDRFELLITRPLPSLVETARKSISARMTTVNWSTSIPGGFDSADVGLDTESPQRSAWMPDPVHADHHAHLAISTGDFLCFEGRIVQLDKGGTANGLIRGVSARGYGFQAAEDAPFLSGGESGTSGAILQAVLTKAAPLLRVNTGSTFWADPGQAHTGAEFNNKFASYAIQQLTTEGGLAGFPWDFYVYDDRQVYFLPRIQPNKLSVYHDLPLDGVIDWREDSTAMYGALQVNYKVGVTAKVLAALPFAGWVDRYGYQRTNVLDAGTLLADANATQLQLTQLNLLANPAVSISAQYDANRPIPSSFGSKGVPSWALRAGDWVTVAGEGPYMIVNTNVSGSSQTTSLTLQTYPPGYLKQLYDLFRMQSNLSHGLNPVTGAPA